jgi:hypothetical protein
MKRARHANWKRSRLSPSRFGPHCSENVHLGSTFLHLIATLKSSQQLKAFPQRSLDLQHTCASFYFSSGKPRRSCFPTGLPGMCSITLSQRAWYAEEKVKAGIPPPFRRMVLGIPQPAMFEPRSTGEHVASRISRMQLNDQSSTVQAEPRRNYKY